MKNDLSKVKVGDTVWLIDGYYRNSTPSERVVTKVARKYISIEEYGHPTQFEISSGREKTDGNYPRYMWANIYMYKLERDRDILFTQLSRELYKKRLPDDLSLEDIRQAAKLLKIDLKGE